MAYATATTDSGASTDATDCVDCGGGSTATASAGSVLNRLADLGERFANAIAPVTEILTVLVQAATVWKLAEGV